MSSRLISMTLAAFIIGMPAFAAQPQKDHFWKPVADDVYLQEVGQKVTSAEPLSAVAVHKGVVYTVANGKVFALRDGALQPAPGAPEGVKRLRALGDSLWAGAGNGGYRFNGDTWAKVDDKPFVDFCMHLGKVHGATTDAVYRFDDGKFVDIKPAGGYLSTDMTLVMADWSQVLADPVEIGPIQRIASYSGTLYLLQNDGFGLIDIDTFFPNPLDWGALPSPNVNDMLAQGSRLFMTTDRGLAVVRGMAMTHVRGQDGLPYEDTTCLATGFADDLWIGTTRGAIRNVGGQFHYFGAQHWLPGDKVSDIAVAGQTVYIATDKGLGVIKYEPYTLQKKAAYFERELDEWGHKRLGFIHKLYRSGDEWLREVSDNDGGHTAHYLAAMSYKFAATGDPKAREEALEAFKAMIWLDDVTPKPGFIARAIWSVSGDKGRRAERGSGGLPAKWYPTADGLWQWKGDTSSDEVNGHIYSVALFHDLVAQGPEKDRAKKHISNIASHIIDNGWVLRDMDDQPTRWGRWEPEYLLTPYGGEARGLNGMEAQTYMITAYALTGDQKFQDGLQQLLKWRYHTFTVRQKLVYPPESVVPWDDELAFRCYHPLLDYTTDPGLRSIYLRSIERHWEIMRMQRVPHFNFTYGALTGNDCEADKAAQHLREWSLDCVNHSFHNSHRHDLHPEPGYVPYCGGTRAISPRESTAMWGSRSAIEYDGRGGGNGVTPPVGWLEDYWMGRYYGLILAPIVADPELTTVDGTPGAGKGAALYKGPPRPKVL